MFPFDLFNFIPAEAMASIRLGAAMAFYYTIVLAAPALALLIASERIMQAFAPTFPDNEDDNRTPRRERGLIRH